MARSAYDYGLQDLDEATLSELAGNRKYGEKSGLAGRELASRRGLRSEADQYRAALERATYQQLSPQFSQGLSRITGSLAGAGPLADSGAANAMRAKLAGNIYGQAQGQIGGRYADFLGNLLNQRRQFMYQRMLQKGGQQKRSPWGPVAGVLGGIGGALAGGPAGAAAGYGIGSNLGGGGYQASDAYYG